MNDVTTYNGTLVPQRSISEMAMAEVRAERSMLQPITLNLSDRLPAGVSIQKIASRWKQFQAHNAIDRLDGLYQVPGLTEAFIQFCADKDPALAAMREDVGFRGGVFDYVLDKAWISKHERGCIADETAAAHIRLVFAIREHRSLLHESLNRLAKIHGVQLDTALIVRENERLFRDLISRIFPGALS